LRRTIVMVGMMGSGKTAVGRAVALRLGVPFLDSDAAIEVAARSTIAEIFEQDGERFFRSRESEVIDRLLSGPPCVLSTGGGAFLSERNRAAIAQKGVALRLDAPLALLWDRVRNKDTRPLLRTADPLATLTDLFTARDPIYALAELSLPVDAASSIEDTANRVVALLKTRPDILETLR
jgi:shikimate kinase